jgi:hypothetical protein
MEKLPAPALYAASATVRAYVTKLIEESRLQAEAFAQRLSSKSDSTTDRPSGEAQQ